MLISNNCSTEQETAPARQPYVKPVFEAFDINTLTMGALKYGSDGVSPNGLSATPLAS